MAKRSPPSPPRLRVAIITSRYNPSVTEALREGAVEEFVERGGHVRDLVHIDAPGAYELPVLALAAAMSDRVHAVVALGCIVRGETRHDRYIADAVAQGLMSVSLRTGLPVGLGVLTTENAKQARDRAGGKHGNKGREAMAATLDAIQGVAALLGGSDRFEIATRHDKVAKAEAKPSTPRKSKPSVTHGTRSR
ncbi:MAG: 6,7-dimethyl-8-ribityllumazine synthase [Phycisphaerales bacterium]|nr:MAG: 6,7-dimethyl-8-ribityllumazine synthase [Phycisphaerales bacterium]